MELLEYLASSPLSGWLSVSLYGFPALIALHSVGMAVVVGLTLMVCLRLHGVLDGPGARTIPLLLNVAVLGFLLNLATGIPIFIMRGPEYIASAIFLVKMALVLLSAVLLIWLRQRLQPWARATGEPLADAPAKAASLLASVTWFAAVLAGRLIAYLSDLY